MSAELGDEVQRLLDAAVYRALGDLLAHRVSGTALPTGGRHARAVCATHRLQLVHWVARWDGVPSQHATDAPRLRPCSGADAPPPHYRPFTDAERRILAALPPGEQRSDQELAGSTGYSRRYVRDVLAGLWRDGLVFKGAAHRWLRVGAS